MRMIINERNGQSLSEEDVTRTAQQTDILDAKDGTNWGSVYKPFSGGMNNGVPGVLAQHGVQAYTVQPPDPITPAYLNQVT